MLRTLIKLILAVAPLLLSMGQVAGRAVLQAPDFALQESAWNRTTFTVEDKPPGGFADGPNLYAYVRQNPWTAFDPEGLFLFGLFDGDKLLSAAGNAATGIGSYANDASGAIFHALTLGYAYPEHAARFQQKTNAAVNGIASDLGHLNDAAQHVLGGQLGSAGADVKGVLGQTKEEAVVNLALLFGPSALKRLSKTAGTMTKAESTAQTILQQNVEQGAAAENLVAGQLAAEGKTSLGRRVSVNTSEGRRVLDNLIDDKGSLVNIEVKSGGGTRSASQVAKDNAMATEGGTLVGKNAPDNLRGKNITVVPQEFGLRDKNALACGVLTCHKAGHAKYHNTQANARQFHAAAPALQSDSHPSGAATGPGTRSRGEEPHVPSLEPRAQPGLCPTDTRPGTQ